MNSSCGFKNKLRKDKIMYANKNYKTDGKVYYMPNKIFDENFSPYEFMIGDLCEPVSKNRRSI